MLLKRSTKPTNFVLPVILSSGIKVNWYYENELLLNKAYRQLKNININIKPLSPIVYE